MAGLSAHRRFVAAAGATRSKLALALTTLLLLAGAGCGPAQAPSPILIPPERHQPFLVATSVTVLADLIEAVGGDRVEARALVPGGADPFTFQPAPRQVLTVARARLIVLNGLGLDRSIRSLVANAGQLDAPIITLAEGLPTLESAFELDDRWGSETADTRRPNAYLWLDPRLAQVYVDRIRTALSQVDPAGAAVYAANAARYVERLSQLDAEVESELSRIPAANRKLLTLHDGFPYFARRFGFEQVGVVIKTPGRQPSAREVAEVAGIIRAGGVRTVFIEPQLDARLLKLAARDAGMEIRTLYSDTLDRHVPTYEALLRYNTRQLVNGLQ